MPGVLKNTRYMVMIYALVQEGNIFRSIYCAICTIIKGKLWQVKDGFAKSLCAFLEKVCYNDNEPET